MSRVNLRLVMQPQLVVSRFNPRFKQAQKWLDNEVVKDSTPYTPMKTGALMRSGINATHYGSGEVVWNTPYAARCYYNKLNFSKDKHPQAQSHWFEKAKAVNKAKWTDGVRKIVKGA